MPGVYHLNHKCLRKRTLGAISSKPLNLQMRKELLRDGAAARPFIQKEDSEQSPRVLVRIQAALHLTASL